MHDGRKRFVWQTIRISAIMALPLSSSIIFYSNDIMHLIGSNYEKGSSSLQILLLSSFPIIVLSGVETLVFSYGKYRHTLTINLASSIPRTILYIILVPMLGMTGVAISYTIGSVIGFISSIIVDSKYSNVDILETSGLDTFLTSFSCLCVVNIKCKLYFGNNFDYLYYLCIVNEIAYNREERRIIFHRVNAQ